jgi:hypothetical protein
VKSYRVAYLVAALAIGLTLVSCAKPSHYGGTASVKILTQPQGGIDLDSIWADYRISFNRSSAAASTDSTIVVWGFWTDDDADTLSPDSATFALGGGALSPATEHASYNDNEDGEDVDGQYWYIINWADDGGLHVLSTDTASCSTSLFRR